YHLDRLNAAGFDGAGQKIGIIAFATYALADVRTFESTFDLPSSPIKLTVAPPLGGRGPDTASAGRQESTLDVTWSSAMAPGAETTGSTAQPPLLGRRPIRR